MPNPLFNRFNSNMNNYQNNNFNGNIFSQFNQAKANPGIVLDILLQRGKINQQQYNELWNYRNNPEFIAKYLINNGNAGGINNAQQQANQIRNNNSML